MRVKSIIGLFKNFETVWKMRDAACYFQPVMTLLWNIRMGILVISVKFLKIENDRLLLPTTI